jgi:hypothetical protein
MTMLDLTLKIEAMNVPPDLQHKTRAAEIMELPTYLDVSMVGTGTKFLINYGSVQPSPDDSQYPWLKLNAVGAPVGWYVNVNGVWSPVPVGGVIAASGPLAIVPSSAITGIHTAGPSVVVVASGGVPPYTWVGGGGYTTTPSGTDNNICTIQGTGEVTFQNALILTDAVNSLPSVISVSYTAP